MVATTHMLTQHHILVDLNPQDQCCEILKSFIYLGWLLCWGCCMNWIRNDMMAVNNAWTLNLEEMRSLWSSDTHLFIRWVVSFLVAGCNKDCNRTEHDVIPGKDRNTVFQEYNFCLDYISNVVKTSIIQHNWNYSHVTEWLIVEYTIFNMARYGITGGICWMWHSTENHMWKK